MRYTKIRAASYSNEASDVQNKAYTVICSKHKPNKTTQMRWRGEKHGTNQSRSTRCKKTDAYMQTFTFKTPQFNRQDNPRSFHHPKDNLSPVATQQVDKLPTRVPGFWNKQSSLIETANVMHRTAFIARHFCGSLTTCIPHSSNLFYCSTISPGQNGIHRDSLLLRIQMLGSHRWRDTRIEDEYDVIGKHNPY